MGTTLGTAYVQIVPSAQGIKGSITNVLSGEGEAAGTAVGGKIGAFVKKAIATAAIGTAVVSTIKASMNEAAKLQQSYFGGLDTLYGEAADAARQHAREAASYGLSMNDYSEQAVSFGAALKGAYDGDVVKAAEAADKAIQDMADNHAKMGTDIESIQMAYQGFAKQNYTMLDNLKLGYGGTKSEMERLLADAKELTGVDYNIDNLGDVYEAIHVIQDNLGLTGVAAAEASQTFSGSFDAMKAAAQNFLGSLALGENVSGALSSLMSAASTFFFGNFLPMLGTLVRSIPPAIATFLQEGIPLLFSNVSAMLTSLGSYVSGLANGITAEKVATWASTTLPQIIQTGAQLIGQFAGTLLKNLPLIISAIRQIALNIVTGLGRAIWGKITQAANGIRDRFMAPINALVGRVQTTANNIKNRLVAPIESAKQKISSVVESIKNFFPLNIGRIFSNLQLPHISVSGGSAPFGIGGKGSLPHFSVDWYAKGGIVTGPTVFSGIGMGEAGHEAILPLDPFWDRMDRIAESMQGGDITINVYAAPGMDVKALAKEVKNELISTENRRRLAWQ